MKHDKWNILLALATATVICAVIFAFSITRCAMQNAIAEEEEVQVEQVPIHDVPAEQVAPQLSIQEIKWQEALQQVPPLTKSGGVGSAGGYKFTYYSSNVLYHYQTSEWRLDNNGCYRAWNGSQWCFVISMNSSYGYMGQTIQFNFGPCIVLDSGCAQGVVDLYVNW